YGGPSCVALAEWHFQTSSDLVIETMRTSNVHVRSVLLGVAAQLMMVMAISFLGEVEPMALFFESYHEFWRDAFTGTLVPTSRSYERKYDGMAESLQNRFDTIRTALSQKRADQLPDFIHSWTDHCE